MKSIAFVVVLALMLAVSAGASELRWEQLPADAGSRHPAGSMLDLAGFVTGEAADDFLSDDGSMITAVEWWGVHAPEQCGSSEHFIIRFYESLPGASFACPDDPPIYTTVSDCCVETWDEQYGQYRYYHQLDVPFYPEAGSVYWISIQGAVSDAMSCAWYWCNSMDYWGDEAEWKSEYDHVNWYCPDWAPFSVYTGAIGEAYYIELAFRLYSQPSSADDPMNLELNWGRIKALFK